MREAAGLEWRALFSCAFCVSGLSVSLRFIAFEMPSQPAPTVIAVDIGNSRIKLGRFDRGGQCANPAPKQGLPIAGPLLPEPTDELGLRIKNRASDFDIAALAEWCAEQVAERAAWLVASVHRGATERFKTAIAELSQQSARGWTVQCLTYRDLPLTILVDEPERVGIDRLLAAVAADRRRQQGRGAIIADAGTAITVDLLDANGAFRGGAIFPGVAMSARALDEQTDALPLVAIDQLDHPPEPLGTSTVTAIESGVYWGMVGAIRELATRLSAGLPEPPDVFLTGGASNHVAEYLARGSGWRVHHEPHLVLAGIALVDQLLLGQSLPRQSGSLRK